jgi:hypothetical protein
MSKLVALLVSGLFAMSLNVFAADAPAAKKEEKKAPAAKPAPEAKPAADAKAK